MFEKDLRADHIQTTCMANMLVTFGLPATVPGLWVGVLMDACWGLFGGLSGPLGSTFEASRELLGGLLRTFWGPLGASFGFLGGHFGASWGLLGASWGLLGAFWGGKLEF